MNDRTPRWLPLMLVAVMLLPLLYVQFAPDDLYIYLKFAKELSQHRQLAFNPGEKSYGFTSPLWLLALAAGFSPERPLLFPKIACFLLYALAVLLFWRMLARLTTLAGSLMGTLLLFLNPWVMRWGLCGLETSATLFATIWFLSWLFCEHPCTWLPASLLPLLRPELLIWTFVYALFLLRRRQLMRILFLVIPALGWHLFAYLHFGQIFPNTAYAKSHALALPLLLDVFKKYLATLQPVDAAALLLAVVWVIKGRLREREWIMVLFIASLSLLYHLRAVKLHTRYMIPLFPLTILLFILMLTDKRKLCISISVLSLLMSIGVQMVSVYPATKSYARSEKAVNIAIGRYFHGLPRQGQPPLLILYDIGAIGFYSDAIVIDLNGIIDRKTSERDRPLGNILAWLRRSLPGRDTYMVDVAYEEKRLLGQSALQAEFLFSKPFFHMFIQQKAPLHYSVYRIH